MMFASAVGAVRQGDLARRQKKSRTTKNVMRLTEIRQGGGN
jgi:hypothetical protein